jgi:hypothetical protein
VDSPTRCSDATWFATSVTTTELAARYSSCRLQPTTGTTTCSTTCISMCAGVHLHSLRMHPLPPTHHTLVPMHINNTLTRSNSPTHQHIPTPTNTTHRHTNASTHHQAITPFRHHATPTPTHYHHRTNTLSPSHQHITTNAPTRPWNDDRRWGLGALPRRCHLHRRCRRGHRPEQRPHSTRRQRHLCLRVRAAFACSHRLPS